MKSSLRTKRFSKWANVLFRSIQVLTLIIIATVAVCLVGGTYNSLMVAIIIGMLILGGALLMVFGIVVILL